MDISFKNKKVEKAFNQGAQLVRMHGTKRAKEIGKRMAELSAAESLMDFWPPKSKPSRCHELEGDRKGQLSVDLDGPYRLVFIPDHDPVPRRDERDDGGLDWSRVTAIKIIGIEDTHE